MPPRLRIGPDARLLDRQLKKETYTPQPGVIQLGRDHDPDEVIETIRPELYKVTAVLAPHAVGRVIAAHKDFAPPTDQATFSRQLSHAAEQAFSDFTVPHAYLPATETLEALLEQISAYEPDAGLYQTKERFFLAGVDTALLHLTAHFNSIRELVAPYRRLNTPTIIEALATPSSRIATNIATHSIEHLEDIRTALIEPTLAQQSPRYRPRLLRLHSEQDVLRAELKRPILDHINPVTQRRIGDRATTHAAIGCPALVQIDGTATPISLLRRYIHRQSLDLLE